MAGPCGSLCCVHHPFKFEHCNIILRPTRDGFFVHNADLELNTCVLVEVVQAREDFL